MIAFLAAQWRRLAIYGVLAAALLGAAWLHGYTRGELKLADYKAAQATAAVKIVVKRGEVTERVVTKYVTRTVPRTQVVTQTVEKEVIRYVEKNPVGLCLDGEWRRVHDAAAGNTVSDSSGGAHGAVRAATTAATGGWRADSSTGAANGDAELREAPTVR